jgi:predicted DNA-binding protein with PD1-like motif
MTLRVHRSERCHHLVLRASGDEIVPDAIVARLGDERIVCGWLRASGVLSNVELRAFDAQRVQPGPLRRIAGPVQALALESSIGSASGEPTLSLRAVLARETDRGLETIAGEVVRARAIALEVLVTVFDDLTLERALDESTGIWLLDDVKATRRHPAPEPAVSVPLPRPAPAAGPAAGWSRALEASAQVDRESAGPPGRAPGVSAQMPQRPTRPGLDLDAPVPEAGDVVDHFAFGRCDVVKSDGERLHVRIPKDGRIREIALEMLRVIPLESEGTGRRFKLERRI